ncbi:hypothetical protein C0Q70_10865 [Pomacea canaliculata]|uniref:Spaetzle domain-containing protein n=1 Tax=Pomacea canaliculata TaxID=400727 RepID=A0A2T7P4E5_POMCA|nr:uncharacterized protein LOC112566591 [Pomacea canaliculata]PVD28278.1 hypothetical protein C0Q70_10865 [Pomacea canaliculata]
MKILWLLTVAVLTPEHPWQSSSGLVVGSSSGDLLPDLKDLSLPVGLLRADDKRSSCTNTSCGGAKNDSLYEEVTKYYRRHFYTPRDIFWLSCNANPKKCQPYITTASTGASDSWLLTTASVMGTVDMDQCCKTTRAFKTMSGLMTTSSGVQCTVLTLNNFYQVVHVGTCDTSSPNGCSGRCRQEMSKVSLLCLRQGALEFNFFDIPSYCSCKAS